MKKCLSISSLRRCKKYFAPWRAQDWKLKAEKVLHFTFRSKREIMGRTILVAQTNRRLPPLPSCWRLHRPSLQNPIYVSYRHISDFLQSTFRTSCIPATFLPSFLRFAFSPRVRNSSPEPIADEAHHPLCPGPQILLLSKLCRQHPSSLNCHSSQELILEKVPSRLNMVNDELGISSNIVITFERHPLSIVFRLLPSLANSYVRQYHRHRCQFVFPLRH